MPRAPEAGCHGCSFQTQCKCGRTRFVVSTERKNGRVVVHTIHDIEEAACQAADTEDAPLSEPPSERRLSEASLEWGKAQLDVPFVTSALDLGLPTHVALSPPLVDDPHTAAVSLQPAASTAVAVAMLGVAAAAQPAPLPRSPRVRFAGAGRTSRYFTWEEVRQHCTIDDLWLVAHGSVYDVTDFVREHPGGVRSLLRHAGKDCTEDFDFHSKSAQHKWRKYRIGRIQRPRSRCVIS